MDKRIYLLLDRIDQGRVRMTKAMIITSRYAV
ncbi:hypothetical protein XaFJ1_GM000831 [Xanthomonas albilineans]|nr:hypothetical protein XaFJ1_GM000831 [Xanthomonas albilineans]